MAQNAEKRLSQPLGKLERKEVDRVALVAFFSMARHWGLKAAEQIRLLGEPSSRTFYRWRAGEVAAVPDDTLERISVLTGIYKSIHILLPIAERADAWVKRPNKAFGGKSALQVMLQGRMDNLYQVRRYLDAWRG